MNARILITREPDCTRVDKRTPELILLLFACSGGAIVALVPLLRLVEPLTAGATCVVAVMLVLRTGWTVRIERSGISARWRVLGIPFRTHRFSFDVPIVDELDWDGYDYVELREDDRAVELDAWHDAATVARTLEEERDRLRARPAAGPYRTTGGLPA